MFKMEYIEDEILYYIQEYKKLNLANVCNVISNCKGNIYFSGIGKSENMSVHCCDLLKSISLRTFFIDISKSLHGDIGTITQDDLIILFSKSGSTREVVEVIPYLKQRNVKIIGICCEDNSYFHKVCDITLKLPFRQEIGGNINKIPTNSCVSFLLFSNILVSKLKTNIDIQLYSQNHPAGDIGKQLRRVRDVMIADFPKIYINKEININLVLLEMTKYKMGICTFLDDSSNIIGILTDGDIRRLLIRENLKTKINIEDLNSDFVYKDNLNDFFHSNNFYTPVVINRKLLGLLIKN